MPPLEDLKTTLKEFIDDLADNIFTRPSEKDDMTLIRIAFSLLGEKDLMDNIIDNVLPYKVHIINRDIKFFVEKKNEIFKGLPQDRVDYFEHLVITPSAQGGMNDEDRDIVWQYFDTIVAIAEDYKKDV